MAVSSFDQQYFALLASRIREGDADAFAELYGATYDQLYRSVYYFLHDPDDIYDALQEIYISVYKNIGSLKLDRLLLPWMRQIAYHTCCDMVRQKQAMRDFSLELDDTLLHGAGEEDDPYRLVRDQDMRDRLNAALARRPVKERQAFLLRYENGLKLEEIAGFMGVSLASVKRYISSARDALKKDLAHLKP